MEWYYAVNNQRQGPIPEAEFEKLVADGFIKGDTLVWHAGMPQWKAFSSVAAELPAPAGAGDDTAICAMSGKRYPKREMIQYEGRWISAEHRDAFFQRLREGVATPDQEGGMPGPHGYAGFWIRFVAKFIDGIIGRIVGAIIGFVVGAIFTGVGKTPTDMNQIVIMQLVIMTCAMAFSLTYEIYFIRTFDATPGKMALGLKILRADGSKLSVGRIVGRMFAHILDFLTLTVGYIMAGFDEEKRALHDRICDTRVIKTR